MASKEEETSQYPEALRQHFQDGMLALTKTERMIFDCYLAGKSTKDILEELIIKENTKKFHNKNIYGKLGVSSRKQLVEVHRGLEKNKP